MRGRRIRAVAYGAGAMGTVATRLMAEKGVDIVGAIARSPQKVGRDLGDPAGIDKINVIVEAADADASLVSDPARHRAALDPELHPRDARAAELSVRHGADVVTIAEDLLDPVVHDSAGRRLPRHCREKQHGVTIKVTGHQDVYWTQMVSMLLGTALRIDRVRGRASRNADDYGAEIIKSKHAGDSKGSIRPSVTRNTHPPTAATYWRIARLPRPDAEDVDLGREPDRHRTEP